MSSKGGQSSQTSTQTSAPWDVQQPYLQQGFQTAQNLAGRPQSYYPNSTVTPFSPQSDLALQLTAGRALQGSPLTGEAQNLGLNTLQGNYLNGSPWLDQMYDRGVGAMTRNFSDSVLPNIDSQFAGKGRYGSDLWSNQKDMAMDNLGRQLEGYATNLYGGNYDQERGRQMQAMSMAPGLAAQDYVDFGQLGNAGAMIEGKAQGLIGDQMNRYNFYQGEPDQRLSQYMNQIGGQYGGTTQGTQTQPMYGGSPFMDILGGGLSLAGMFGGGGAMPWGATAGGMGAIPFSSRV